MLQDLIAKQFLKQVDFGDLLSELIKKVDPRSAFEYLKNLFTKEIEKLQQDSDGNGKRDIDDLKDIAVEIAQLASTAVKLYQSAKKK